MRHVQIEGHRPAQRFKNKWGADLKSAPHLFYLDTNLNLHPQTKVSIVEQNSSQY